MEINEKMMVIKCARAIAKFCMDLNVFRIGEIVGAMSRYAEAQKPVPIEWVNESADRLSDYMREVEE